MHADGLHADGIRNAKEGFEMAALLIFYVLLFIIMYRIYKPAKYQKVFPWIKLATSLCFILIALYSAFLSRQYPMFLRMIPAFVLAALGDWLLGVAHSKNDSFSKEFLTGTCSFLMAHVVFYAALTSIDRVRAVDFIIPLAVMGLVFLTSRSRNVRLGKMKIPGIIYSFFVGLLFSKGILIVIYTGVSTSNILILIGSALFLISDYILIFLNFHVAPPKWLAFANLSTYYAAMALLGLSLYPF